MPNQVIVTSTSPVMTIKAAGVAGPQGSQGPTGPQGPQGPSGGGGDLSAAVILAPLTTARNVIDVSGQTSVVPLTLKIPDGVDTALEVRDASNVLLASIGGDAGFTGSYASLQSALIDNGGRGTLIQSPATGSSVTTLTLPDAAIPGNDAVMQFTSAGVGSWGYGNTVAVSTGTQSIDCDAAYHNVTGVSASVAANAVYDFTAAIYVDASDYVTFRVNGTTPAGAVGGFFANLYSEADIQLSVCACDFAGGGAPNLHVNTMLIGVVMPILIRGSIKTTTAGTIQMQLFSDSAGQTMNVYAGSYIRLTRIA